MVLLMELLLEGIGRRGYKQYYWRSGCGPADRRKESWNARRRRLLGRGAHATPGSRNIVIVVDLVLRGIWECSIMINFGDARGVGVGNSKRANARQAIVVHTRSTFVPSF